MANPAERVIQQSLVCIPTKLNYSVPCEELTSDGDNGVPIMIPVQEAMECDQSVAGIFLVPMSTM